MPVLPSLQLRQRPQAMLDRKSTRLNSSHSLHDALPIYPAAHIHVAVSRARPGWVDVQADARFAVFAVAAAPAGDVERHRNQVTDFDELHVAPGLDHFTRNLMPQNQSLRSGRAAAHHVLVAAANIGADDFENDAVLAFARA